MNFNMSIRMPSPYFYSWFRNSEFLFCLVQVVVAPILLGSYIQSSFPWVVKIITPFAPLFAVLASSLLACRFSVIENLCCMLTFSLSHFTLNYSFNFVVSWIFPSVFSENVVRFKSSVVNALLASDASLTDRILSLLSGELGVVILSVLLLHFAGFFVG